MPRVLWKGLLKATILTFTLSGIVSCQKTDGINQFLPTPTESWSPQDTLFFELPEIMHEGDFDVQVQARITYTYPYRSLRLVVEQAYGESDSIAAYKETVAPDLERKNQVRTYRDTVLLDLVDDCGNFTGKGRDLLEYDMPVRYIHMQSGESGEIRIFHVQAESNIRGVHDVGLQITPLKKTQDK